MEIRKTDINDMPVIKAMCEAEGWSYIVSHWSIYSTAAGNSECYSAVEGDEVLGYVRAVTDGSFSVYICEIPVAASHRGKGIGKALLDYARELTPDGRTDLLSDADGFYDKAGGRNMGSGYRFYGSRYGL